MIALPTLPRRTWLERILFGFAALLILVGVGGLAGWWLHIDGLILPWGASEPIQPDEALSFAVLGAVLVCLELGWRSAAWLCALPIGFSALTLVEAAIGRDVHISDVFLIDHLYAAAAHAGRGAAIGGACIGLGALVVAWPPAWRFPRTRTLCGAVAGSLLSSVGFSTLVGYAGDMRRVYSWSGEIAMSPGTAIALFLLGSSLLLLVWRDSVRERDEFPSWTPMPAVIGCLTLTLIVWTGLRERERVGLENQTNEAMKGLAMTIHAKIEEQNDALERLARSWAEAPEYDTIIWEADAHTQLDRSNAAGAYGCQSIAYLDSSGQTRWIYPRVGNEWAIDFNHLSVAARSEAIADARAKGHPSVSATTTISGGSQAGFAIYAPVTREGRLAGYVAAEYGYLRFFGKVVDSLGYTRASEVLGPAYRVTVTLGKDVFYDGGAPVTGANSDYTANGNYPIFDRRVQLSVTPSEEQLARGRGSLAEFVLLGGIGISALLGLTVYLACRARAGQLASELSNRKLQVENEERRRIETRLKISDERLRLALDSTEIGIFEWNVATGHVYYSSGLWAMLGYEHDRMPGTLEAWQSLIHPDDLAVYRPRVESQLNGSATYIELEYRIRTRTGDWRWIYGRSKSISTDTEGRPARIIGTVQDVTARVETEHHLRRAKAEADAASRAKSDFLASMSHEIRTPMNGIIGMTSLITETPLTVEQRDYVNTIRTSSEALLTIINDILDFSKIESGKMEIENTPFGLALCLEETLDLFAVKAAEKNIEIGYSIARDVPPWISGDVTRLWQVITNLVNNAVKFTSFGSVSVEVKRGAPAEGNRFLLEFAIRDTGIGIPSDRLNRLFKAFSQVDSSTTRKYGGTGLGLAISQRLSHLMGGSIRVESEVGKGSAFIFTILTEPAPLPIDIDYLPPLPAPLRGGTVLCIEDNPVTQARLRGLLEKWGVTCVIVPDLPAAEKLVAANGVVPVMAVVDHGALEYQAVPERFAALQCPRLVMVPFGRTVASSAADGRPFASVTKPLKDSSFMHAVETLFSTVSTEEAAVVSSESHILAQDFPLSVLLAEDNPVNQKVALGYLERMGYRAGLVVNGIEAVAAVESRPYDLVLMDLQMPEMDGLEASRQIRRRVPAERQPKIIALTANAMEGDRELCEAAGMDDYISKPVKLNEMAAAIRRQFAKTAKPAKREQIAG